MSVRVLVGYVCSGQCNEPGGDERRIDYTARIEHRQSEAEIGMRSGSG